MQWELPKTSRKEPFCCITATPLPRAPWKELSMDFLGPLPSGDYLMVVIDEYSRFPEVEIVTSTSARSTIPKLDAIFARQGIPDVLKSDNGPPFNGTDFKNFAELLGFQHRKITPLWPRANGEAERFIMTTLEKCIRAATVEHKNWKQELNKFLRQYRATPHSTTGISPCEALNQRKLKTTLPEFASPAPARHQIIPETQNLAERDAEQKKKIKAYADQKLGARESKIKLGDTVLVKQPKTNKLSTPFSPAPLVVESSYMGYWGAKFSNGIFKWNFQMEFSKWNLILGGKIFKWNFQMEFSNGIFKMEFTLVGIFFSGKSTEK